ncbi:MAG: preprotein translocase subunit SecE [Lachnospiraceae bacterium]
MAENAKLEKAPKTSWFDGLKAEFHKIKWTAKETLAKQTAAVVAVSVALGLLISILDRVIQYGVDFLVNL